MNWEAIGAIGEIVGALAVVTTLLYLSVQIRESRKVSVAEGSSKGMELHSNWRNTLLQNTDAAATLAKANVGEELSERERVQLQFLSDELFFASVISNEFSVHSGSFYTDDSYVTYLNDILRSNPGLVPEWRRFRTSVDFVSPEYGERIDTALEKLESDGVSADS